MLGYLNEFVFTQAAAITTSDSAAVDFQSIWVGGAGNVKVDIAEPRGGAGGTPAISTVTFNSVAAGTRLPINVVKVYATGTTATNMVGLR